MTGELDIRFATPDDIDTLLTLIGEFAAYERAEAVFSATKEDLLIYLFDKKYADALLFYKEGELLGYCVIDMLFFPYRGRPVLHLANIYIREAARGLGLGKKVFSYLCQLGLERGCVRFDWGCLNWNTASIEFYKKIGGIPFDVATAFRMPKERMEEVAAGKF